MTTQKELSTEELKDLCREAIVTVRKVGAFIKKEGQNFDLSKIEYKGAKDLVSYVDKESERRLVQGLKDLLPLSGFIAEEGTNDTIDKEYQWIIDPLDGTTNFLHGLPIFSISVALRYRDTVVLGIVYDPSRDDCFYAVKNGGAYCNDKPLKASSTSELDRSLIVTGFPYSLLDKGDIYMKIFHEFAEKTHGIRRLGSAAIDLAYVAAGRFEGYYEFNLKIWDVAAGILLVQEAGGIVTDFSGGNDFQSGREVLATGAAHAEMLRVIRGYWGQH